jgi:GNAT superfamily N-acetyltransferase
MGVAPVLTIRRAQPADFDTVMALLAGSTRWLRERGSDQWSTGRGFGRKVRPAIAAGNVWLLHDDDTPVGTITLDTAGDTDFWTPAELDEPSLYLSKLAVARDRAGSELGVLLLDWAADRAWRQGRTWLRLDAWKTNRRLHRYYLDRGWTYLRTSTLVHRHSGALFQRFAAPLPQGVSVSDDAPPTMIRSANSGRWESDGAGNWMPHHTHTVPGLTVDNPWVGPTSPLLMPDARYRIRPTEDGWVLEREPAHPGRWDRVGPVLAAPDGLLQDATVVITHVAAQPCGLAVDTLAIMDAQHIAA